MRCVRYSLSSPPLRGRFHNQVLRHVFSGRVRVGVAASYFRLPPVRTKRCVYVCVCVCVFVCVCLVCVCANRKKNRDYGEERKDILVANEIGNEIEIGGEGGRMERVPFLCLIQGIK